MKQTLSQEHEQEIASAFRQQGYEAKVQPGSGNKADRPNDVYVQGHFMIECKATEAKQITVKLAWLNRVRDLARGFGLRGFVALRWKVKHPHFPGAAYYRDVFIVDADYFGHLLECEKQCTQES